MVVHHAAGADLTLTREIEYDARSHTLRNVTGESVSLLLEVLADIIGTAVKRADASEVMGQALSWGNMGHIQNFPTTVKSSVLRSLL